MEQGSCEYRAAEPLAVVLAASLLLASPSAAQEYPLPSERPESRTCAVFAGASVDGMQEVRARCWGTALNLGYADRFRAFDNPALRSTVVEIERGGKRRVLLLRPFVDEQPLVEDISGTLAVAAGRVSWAGIDGLTLDFGQFATSGRIGIAPDPLAAARVEGARTSDSPGSSVEANEIRIDQYIALDEARLAAAQSTVTEAK